MFQRTMLLGLVLLFPLPLLAAEGLTIHTSQYDVETTEAHLLAALEKRELGVFSRIDHTAGAHSVDLDLPPIRLVLFGNPRIGSRLMQCAPTMGVDLPMKALIWKSEGTVRLGYNAPDYLAARHAPEGCEAILDKVGQALDGLAREATGN